MVKNTQTIRQHLPTNYLKAFDHLVGLALKELSYSISTLTENARKLWFKVRNRPQFSLIIWSFLASELESDLWDTMDWDRKWLVDFTAGKTQLVSLERSNNTGAIDVKMDRSVFEKKSYRKMLEMISLLDWIGSLTLCLLLKLPLRKLESWFVLWSFFLLKLLCITINLPYVHVCNTVVTSGLVLLIATWNC